MRRFRFEGMEVWKDAIQLTGDLLFLIEKANDGKQFTYSSQLHRALISISNNIAEGAGSASKKEFAHFLNISHRSAFECVNLLHLGKINGLLEEDELDIYKAKLDSICRQLESFRKYLLNS